VNSEQKTDGKKVNSDFSNSDNCIFLLNGTRVGKMGFMYCVYILCVHENVLCYRQRVCDAEKNRHEHENLWKWSTYPWLLPIYSLRLHS